MVRFGRAALSRGGGGSRPNHSSRNAAERTSASSTTTVHSTAYIYIYILLLLVYALRSSTPLRATVARVVPLIRRTVNSQVWRSPLVVCGWCHRAACDGGDRAGRGPARRRLWSVERASQGGDEKSHLMLHVPVVPAPDTDRERRAGPAACHQRVLCLARGRQLDRLLAPTRRGPHSDARTRIVDSHRRELL